MDSARTASTGKQVGLAALNLLLTLLILFGAQFPLRGRINNSIGLAILSFLVFGAYLFGYRFIEGRHPPELGGLISLKDFAGGLGVGVALFSALIVLPLAPSRLSSTGPGDFRRPGHRHVNRSFCRHR